MGATFVTAFRLVRSMNSFTERLRPSASRPYFARRTACGPCSMNRSGRPMRSVLIPVSRASSMLSSTALPKPPAEYRSMLDIFKKVLEHEKHVTASIHKLYAQAIKENDYASQVTLQWFVSEQVEEEKNATAIVEQIPAVGDSKGSLMYIDRALGKRAQ